MVTLLLLSDIFNEVFKLVGILGIMIVISYFISSFLVLIACGLYKLLFKRTVFHHTQDQLLQLVTTCITGYIAYIYCSDFYPYLATPIVLISLIVLGCIIGIPRIKNRKQSQPRTPKPSITTTSIKKENKATSFDIAFARQMGQDPASYISSKLRNNSDSGAVRYAFEIIEAEIEKKSKRKSPGYAFYYAKAINQQEKTYPSIPCIDSCSSGIVHKDDSTEHPQINTCIVDDKPSALLPSVPKKELNIHYSSYGYDTLKGEKVKSYGEAVIANMLYREGIKYEYERLVQLEDHFVRPDFSILIPSKGEMIYWEHCGMLNDPEYRAKWEQKKAAYKRCNIIEGKNLIVTHGTEQHVLKRIIANLHLQIDPKNN